MSYLVIQEAAERCRVHPNSIRRWLKSGALKHKRAGRRILIDPAELERFIEPPERQK